MKYRRIASPIKLVLTTLSAMVLTACGGGGGGGSSAPATTVPLSGSAVKGPLANAVAEAFEVDATAADLRGASVAMGSTSASAQLSGINLDPADAPFLLVVSADADTIDITTGEFPVITSLQTIVTADALENDTPIFATPLTSMAVEVVASQDDTTTDNFEDQLDNAGNQVKTTLGFGIDETLDIFTTPPLLTEETDTEEEQQAAAEYRLAIEALSAVVADIASETSADDTAADVLAALAEDLSDGQFDGMAGDEMVDSLDGYDVSDIDDYDVNNLTIPGTDIPVNDVEDVLVSDTETTNVDQELDENVDAEGESPSLVADSDLDTIGDDVDNCPVNANTDQSDTNENGVGDVCDAAPVIAAELSATVDEDSIVVVDLSQGVSDAEGDDLSYSVDGQNLDGPNYSFSPDANFNGETSFQYSVSDGTSTTSGTVNVAVVAQNDIGSVAISGIATQGQTLMATVIDAIDGLLNAVITYIWSDDSGEIAGANQSTLLLTQDQVGSTITVTASFTDDEGFSEIIDSDPTAEVEDVNDPPSGQLSLNGVAREDETVSVDTAGLSDVDGDIVVVAYQWNADGSPIEGATNATFEIPAELVGATLSVDVTFSDAVFTEETITQTAAFEQSVANSNDLASGTVSISNTSPTEDDQLTASLEDLVDEDGTSNATFSYQWRTNGQDIEGANTSSFSPTQSEVGTTLSVVVSFNDDFGSPESLTSAETDEVANLNDDPEGNVTITGSPVVGATLSASNTLTDEDGIGDITYEWFVDGTTTNVFESGYTVDQSDVGGNISVVASYQDAFGQNESAESDPVVATDAPLEGDISLIGSWDFDFEEFNTYDKTILTFTQTGEFFFFNINTGDNDDCRERGFEYGTYERDGDAISLTRIVDSNGCVGLFDVDESSIILTVAAVDAYTIRITNNDDPSDPIDETGTRILTTSQSIVGSWHEPEDECCGEDAPNGLSNVIIFVDGGLFYSMDVRPSTFEENGFSYGSYTGDVGGDGITLNIVFNREDNDVGESTFPDVEISEGRLFVEDQNYGLIRVAVDPEMPDPALDFTQSELNGGLAVYIPLLEPEDCGDSWVVETFSFNANGYTLDVCGAGSGDEVDEAYEVLQSGIVRLIQTEEYVKRLSFDPHLQAFTICWADTEEAANSCPEEIQGLAFIGQADANNYASARMASVPQRLKLVRIDLDNNGVIDELDEFSYGSDNRLLTREVTYIGDGVEDSYPSISNEERTLFTYLHNSRGQLVEYVIEFSYGAGLVFDENAATGRQESRYQYGNEGELTSHETISFNLNDAEITGSDYTFEYTDGVMSSYLQITVFNGQTTEYEADYVLAENGLVDYITYGLLSASEEEKIRSEYSWEETGALKTFRQLPENISLEINLELFRDDSQVLQTQENMTDPDTTQGPINSSLSYFYDEAGLLERVDIDTDYDGSTDAVYEFEWEDQECVTSFIWGSFIQPNYTLEEAPSTYYTPGTNFGRVCGFPRLL